MALLGELSIIERLVGRLEIGAAILLVGVKKEPVEPAVEIVVMRDIAPRTGPRVELLHTPEEVAAELQRQCPPRRGDVILPQQNGKQVRDRALVDDESAVHIGFAQSELRIEKDAALGFGAGEAHGDRGPAAIAKSVRSARRRCDFKGPVAYEAPQEYR